MHESFSFSVNRTILFCIRGRLFADMVRNQKDARASR